MSLVFIISAPSGSGKSTLVSRLMEALPDLTFSISYTTRAPRGKEVDGVDYHFLTREQFETEVLKGEFLEHFEVFGNFYGTHRSVLDNAGREGKDLVLDIDVQGARKLRGELPEAITILVLPPSRQVLEERLRARSMDSEETIQRRLDGAAEEVRQYRQYDYLLINNDLERSSAELIAIVRAERIRRVHMEQRVRPILESFETVRRGSHG